MKKIILDGNKYFNLVVEVNDTEEVDFEDEVLNFENEILKLERPKNEVDIVYLSSLYQVMKELELAHKIARDKTCSDTARENQELKEIEMEVNKL